jgi:hypothetical protein
MDTTTSSTTPQGRPSPAPVALCQDGCGAVEIAKLIYDANSPPGRCPCGGDACCCEGCLSDITPGATNEELRAACLASWDEYKRLHGHRDVP